MPPPRLTGRIARKISPVMSALALALSLELGASITGSCAVPAAATAPDDSVLTVEDLLHAESLGNAWFSPDGARVLFARERAVIDVADRSYDDPQMANQRLYVFERRSGRTHEIAPPANATLTFIDTESPWEPNGRGVLLICVVDGTYRLAYWSTSGGAVTVLPGRPTTRSLTLAWVDGRVAYPVLAEQERQQFANRPLLETAARKWQQAWTGASAEVTISSVNPLVATTRPPEGSLLLADTNGHAVRIADGDFRTVATSPDGRSLAAVRLAEDDSRSLSNFGQRGELQIFSIRDGSARLLHTYADLDVQAMGNFGSGFGALAWSPHADRLLVGGKRIAEPRERQRPLEILILDGTVREVTAGDLQFVDPDVFAAGALLPMGWLDQVPLVIAARHERAAPSKQARGLGLDYGERQGLRFDLFLLTAQGPQNLTAFSKTGTRSFIVRYDGASALVIADGALWRVASSGPARRLSSPSVGVVLDFLLDRRWPVPLTTSAYYRSGRVERVALLTARDRAVQVVFDLQALRPIRARQWDNILASSPDLLSTVTKDAQGWRRRLILHDDEREHLLMSVNEQLRRKAIAPATKFQYRSGGQQWAGWYLSPPTWAKTRPLPAIVVVYGGTIQGDQPEPDATATPSPPVLSGQLIAAQGYAVIYPSLPLESGRTSDAMTVLADATVAAVDALAAQGVVDAARVGVMGQSFGGWSAAAILAKRSDRFRAGVAMAGLYDFAYSYGTVAWSDLLTDDGRFHGTTLSSIEDGYLRLGPLWKDPQAYQRNSPLYQADRMDAPLLILAGDLDLAATGLAGATRMYNALVRAGKQPVLARYWGEGHVAASPAAWRDQWYRVSTWFDAYLKH
jgi:dipeptidyl aminopeptidase/acylaminoacyl peptidase